MVRKSKELTQAETEEQERQETGKEIGKENQPIRHGAVLTGGIDSTVMLAVLKERLSEDAEIIPITIGVSKREITPILNELRVMTQRKSFDDIDYSDADETKMLPLLEWAIKNKISVIHFGANHDEQQHNIPGKTYDYFARLNSLTDVIVDAPLITVTKDEIIKLAVDKYNIDISQLAEPKPIDEDSDDTNGLAQKYQKIRKEGFAKAFSTKQDKFIQDPFEVKAKESEKEEKQEKEGET